MKYCDNVIIFKYVREHRGWLYLMKALYQHRNKVSMADKPVLFSIAPHCILQRPGLLLMLMPSVWEETAIVLLYLSNNSLMQKVIANTTETCRFLLLYCLAKSRLCSLLQPLTVLDACWVEGKPAVFSSASGQYFLVWIIILSEIVEKTFELLILEAKQYCARRESFSELFLWLLAVLTHRCSHKGSLTQ